MDTLNNHKENSITKTVFNVSFNKLTLAFKLVEEGLTSTNLTFNEIKMSRSKGRTHPGQVYSSLVV